MMQYKNYIGMIDFDDEAGIFYGEVINTRDVITFQGSSAKEIKKAFIDSIEDYLEFCSSRGEEPEKPFSGKFNVRLTPQLHRAAYITAKLSGKSLNKWLLEIIQRATVPNNSKFSASMKHITKNIKQDAHRRAK